MQTFWEMEKTNEVVNNYFTISAQKTRQTNTQSNLLIITVSCEKKSCLIRSKKKKASQNKKADK